MKEISDGLVKYAYVEYILSLLLLDNRASLGKQVRVAIGSSLESYMFSSFLVTRGLLEDYFLSVL